jgi:hypothetical protein
MEIQISGQEIIEQQKMIISNLQHENMVSQMMFKKVSGKLQEVEKELEKYKPKEESLTE